MDVDTVLYQSPGREGDQQNTDMPGAAEPPPHQHRVYILSVTMRPENVEHSIHGPALIEKELFTSVVV